ncbi:hypothetical protein PTKIN_Ptkin03bG0180600 [Pterospermum kingtungense]
MGCGNVLFTLIITFSVALITYNILISANAPLRQDLPGPSRSSIVDPCRVMYYWFKKFKDGPNSEMGGFTRILHSGKPDNYMDEIPTFIAQPLPAGTDQLHTDGRARPYYCQAYTKLIKRWAWSCVSFFYMEPKKYESVLRKFFPEDKDPITNIDPIGISPLTVGKKDPEADKAFGWVLEMYAYAVSSALHGVGNILYKDFMIQV